jgi:hypothetical protein
MRGQLAEAVFDDLCEPQNVLLQSSGRIAAVVNSLLSHHF